MGTLSYKCPLKKIYLVVEARRLKISVEDKNPGAPQHEHSTTTARSPTEASFKQSFPGPSNQTSNQSSTTTRDATKAKDLGND